MADWNKKTNNQNKNGLNPSPKNKSLINEEHSAEGLDNQAK